MAILPPFIDLIAFDAAARHGTFTRAARDLNVSQPAISRRVAALEADLGVSLFSRDTKPLRLTADGQQLFDVLRSGLSRLEAAVQDIRARKNGQALTIAAGPGFLSFWLIPRLPALRLAFPDVDLRIMTGDQAGTATYADIHIRFGSGNWPGVNAGKILGEEVYAVCSPLYLQDRPTPLTLDDLKRAKLLQLSDTLERWYEWRSWFDALGTPVTARLDAIDFDSYAHLIGAALAGQGVALCWSGLLDEYLLSGALLRVSDETMTSSRGYHATYLAESSPDSTVLRIAKLAEDCVPERLNGRH